MNSRENLRPVQITKIWGHGSIQPINGYFHRWGEKLNDITDGSTKVYGAAEVVGIVEAESGEVYEAAANGIKFLD